MKNITVRLSELEAKIKEKNAIPVLVVSEDEPGAFTFAGHTMTREELDKFCRERSVETLIIDNLRRVEDDG